tara:strand:- start:3546 stop:4133 length:588 start_codon:yes stop_codon:yes gene_type:complete
MRKNIIIGILILSILYILYKVGKLPMFTPDYDKGNNNGGIEPAEPTEPVGRFKKDIVHARQELNNDLMQTRNKVQRQVNRINGRCNDPRFDNIDISGRQCAGTTINENKLLRLGDQSCAVLLLQQRLNSIETNRDVLIPNGQFNCATQQKLIRLIGLPEIRLNDFQPDEQVGFDELREGKSVSNYSYMDINNYKK